MSEKSPSLMIKTILENLQTGLDKLESGTLSPEDMELLVEDAKELYERAIILRYRIYQTNVLGVREPVISASIRQTQIETPIDLFGSIDETPEAPEFEVTFAISDSEELEQEQVNEIEEQVNEIEEVNEIKEVAEEEVVEAPTQWEPQFSNDQPIWMAEMEANIRDSRSVFPLESLIGAFTLNEKLQFINELFEGSSDDFSNNIKLLDQLSTMDAARSMVTALAKTHNWDTESEITEDFMYKICRRHAAGA